MKPKQGSQNGWQQLGRQPPECTDQTTLCWGKPQETARTCPICTCALCQGLPTDAVRTPSDTTDKTVHNRVKAAPNSRACLTEPWPIRDKG